MAEIGKVPHAEEGVAVFLFVHSGYNRPVGPYPRFYNPVGLADLEDLVKLPEKFVPAWAVRLSLEEMTAFLSDLSGRQRWIEDLHAMDFKGGIANGVRQVIHVTCEALPKQYIIVDPAGCFSARYVAMGEL